MPAYATNMRLKFPIVALTLEIITIILFAVFVVYDDGKGHENAKDSNETHTGEPMDLYPSKCPWVFFSWGVALLLHNCNKILCYLRVMHWLK